MSRVVAGLSLIAFVALGLLVYLHIDKRIERVTVAGGLDDAERAEIRAAVDTAIDGGLLSVDLETLRQAVLALSWPRGVTIRRNWPASLAIEVEKATVVATWRDGFLASDGSVVTLPGSHPELPMFDCRLAEPRLAMEVYHLLSGAADAGGLAITTLSENDLGEWSLVLSGTDGRNDGNHDGSSDGSNDRPVTVQVRLGAEHIVERFDRFLTVYRSQLSIQDRQVERVDARYDNGVAVSWRGADEVAAAARMNEMRMKRTADGV